MGVLKSPSALCTRFLLRVSREIMRKYGRKSVVFIRRFHLGNFSARALPLGMLHFQLITTGAYIEFSHLFFINYFKQMMKYKNMFINLCNSFIKPQKFDINSGMIFRNSPSKQAILYLISQECTLYLHYVLYCEILRKY